MAYAEANQQGGKAATGGRMWARTRGCAHDARPSLALCCAHEACRMTMSERGTVHGIMYCVRDREICHLPHVHVQRDCAVCVPVCISTVKPFFFVARE